MANESLRIDKSLSFATLASPPTDPHVGEIYFDGSDLLTWDGATWVPVGTGGGGGGGSEAIITEWTLDATITPSAGFGTTTLGSVYTRRVGDTLQCYGMFRAGTTSAALAYFDLGGLNIDVAKVTTELQAQKFGVMNIVNAGSAQQIFATANQASVFYYDGVDPTMIHVGPTTSGNVIENHFVSDFVTTGDNVTFEFSVPIAGWTAAGLVVYLKDYKTSGTDGGISTAYVGTWLLRTLNTLENPFSVTWITLVADQFTLEPGTYAVQAQALALSSVNTQVQSRIRIRNITDSTTELLGTSDIAGAAIGFISELRSMIDGIFTVSSTTKTFELQQQVSSSPGQAFDLGIAAGFGEDELYTQMKITKL